MKFVVVRSEAVVDDGTAPVDGGARVSLSQLCEGSQRWFDCSESAQVATAPDARAFRIASVIGGALREDRSVALVQVEALEEPGDHAAVDAERVQQELDWLRSRDLPTVLVTSGVVATLIDRMMSPTPDGGPSATQQIVAPTREYTI